MRHFHPSLPPTLMVALLLIIGCDQPATGPPASSADADPRIFQDITRTSGITFVHQAGTTGRYFMPEMTPPGVALFDFDRDGDLDLYLVNSGDLDDRGLPHGKTDEGSTAARNRLYRQDDGGQFVDVTLSSGLGDAGYGMGAAVGDIDNDGFPDVYLSNLGADRLYRNNRDGTFSDVTATAGIDNIHWTTSVSLLDFDETWIDEAVELADMVLEHFRDNDEGGFFYTADDHEELITRIKDTFDNATPSSNAMTATALLRLGKLCGNTSYLQAAAETLQLVTGVMERSAIAGSQSLLALDMQIGPTPEIVILGHPDDPTTGELLENLRRRYLPNRILCNRGPDQAGGSVHLQEIFSGKQTGSEPTTVFVCENFTCQAPVTGKAAIRETWDRLAAHHVEPGSH